MSFVKCNRFVNHIKENLMFFVKSFKKSTALLTVLGAFFISTYTQAATELKVAFNQSKQHPQYQALEELSHKFSDATQGKYKLTIYPNELLGNQRASLELVQNGAIQMAVVANPLVENYDRTFLVLALPYLYKSTEHQEHLYTSDILDPLFASTSTFGFDVLAAYTAGARSLYVKGKPITAQADLKGKKIRVLQSDAMMKTLSCMGGVGVPMNQGEVYTAIQQGVLDGAENNEITYTDLKHYEVAPYFTRTQHLRVADLLVISNTFLSGMSPEEQALLRKLAKESVKTEFTLWNQQIQSSEQLAKDKGATFIEIDTTPFRESCKNVQQELLKTPEQKALFEQIMALE
ncbi:TRAP transporter substrate-binding protein [Necropsobacter rosorum]